MERFQSNVSVITARFLITHIIIKVAKFNLIMTVYLEMFIFFQFSSLVVLNFVWIGFLKNINKTMNISVSRSMSSLITEHINHIDQYLPVILKTTWRAVAKYLLPTRNPVPVQFGSRINPTERDASAIILQFLMRSLSSHFFRKFDESVNKHFMFTYSKLTVFNWIS